LAVKITRQTKNIALLGAATSAAALRAGLERAPAALRAAGLADRLKAAGFSVADQGDTAIYPFQPDEDHPRARNVSAILKSLNDLRPRVEVAVKSGALPVILSGDCISVLAVVAGTRRYYRNVSLIYVDRDADLNVPATTPSGCVDGMVISQVIGRGAPELVRFWGEPPLVRAPDIAIFGFERLDPPEEQFLVTSPLRRHPSLEVSSVGAAAAARLARCAAVRTRPAPAHRQARRDPRRARAAVRARRVRPDGDARDQPPARATGTSAARRLRRAARARAVAARDDGRGL